YFHTGKRAEPAPYLLEGLGDEFIIGTADFSVIDEVYRVTDEQAFLSARELVRREGMMAGGSSGAALWGVLKLIRTLDRPARIVTIFPDSATRYLRSIFDDDWMKEHGYRLERETGDR
ncbi:MAG: pyridoxal-phosphate dependent enzyme, partial [Gemmatimonadales bacterium]